MKNRFFLLSSINLLFITVLFLFAFSFFLFSWKPETQDFIFEYLRVYHIGSLKIAFLFFAIAVFFSYISYRLQQNRYYIIHMGENLASISETAIKNSLAPCWKKLFPNTSISPLINIPNNTIEICVDFPYIPLNQKEETLEKIEDNIRETLASSFHYYSKFRLIASFNNKPLDLKTPPPLPEQSN